MSFKIRQAHKAAWPEVQKSLAIHTAKREEVEENPSAYSESTQKRVARPWTRIVSEETVWALGKSGMLASEEHAAVIRAAQRWAKFYHELEDPEEEDVELYNAVQALAASLAALDSDEVVA